MLNSKFKLFIRKGSQLMQAYVVGYTTALHIARAYTDMGHDVALVSYPEIKHLEITASAVDSMLGCNT